MRVTILKPGRFHCEPGSEVEITDERYFEELVNGGLADVLEGPRPPAPVKKKQIGRAHV